MQPSAAASRRDQFVTGEDLEVHRGWRAQALALARELPHVRHGGAVLVQKTIPTDAPPGEGR